MVNKTLVGGIIGFILGGLVVSTAAIITGYKEQNGNAPTSSTGHSPGVTDTLESLKGDAFDKAFIQEMILHHQGAIDMAKLIEPNAKHEELKALGNDIIAAQSQEIDMMKAWEIDWGYENASTSHGVHGM